MEDDTLDVRGAARLVRRHPETVRRWVSSGRLPARRKGNRLLVSRGDLEAVANLAATDTVDLATWTKRAHAARLAGGAAAQRPSAADLVLEDRSDRSRQSEARAGR